MMNSLASKLFTHPHELRRQPTLTGDDIESATITKTEVWRSVAHFLLVQTYGTLWL